MAASSVMRRVSLRNLRAHKLRLFLTVFSIVLGTSFVAGTIGVIGLTFLAPIAADVADLRPIDGAIPVERVAPDPERPETLPRLPKTIDFSVDYLRSGLARDAYARARVVRQGRRYASVHVEAWQDNRTRLFAQATGHFLMPPANG